MGYIFQIVRDIDPKFRILIDTFTLIGLAFTSKFLFQLLLAIWQGFRTHVWSRIGLNGNFKEKYGQWAVITGATDGVGLEYARQFARKDLNLIILGRNPDKLAKVRHEILTNNKNIQVVTIEADLNSDDRNMFSRIKSEIDSDNRDIGILVNNAGVMYDSPNRFLDQPEVKLWQHVKVNMLAVIMMTRIVLPTMVQKKKGLIINIGSIAGYQPLPLMGLYSATKVSLEKNS